MKRIQIVGVVVLGLVVAYPVSIGPATWLMAKGYLDYRIFNTIYDPILGDDGPIRHLVYEWEMFCIPKPPPVP